MACRGLPRHTTKSVTYVLNLSCDLCSEPAPDELMLVLVLMLMLVIDQRTEARDQKSEIGDQIEVGATRRNLLD